MESRNLILSGFFAELYAHGVPPSWFWRPITVMAGDTLYNVEAGGWHFRPHGIVHTFWNDKKSSRFIEMYFN